MNYREVDMRTLQLLCIISVVGGVLMLAGCGSSNESTSKDQSSSSTSQTSQKAPDQNQTDASQKTDTVPVDNKDSPQQPYDPHSSAPVTKSAMPTGKFSVQVGAYKQQENADRVAALAKDRFGMNIYTIPDALSGLVKVYVGDFAVKDEARKFRDEMAQKYPVDYKDAWVSENPSK